MCSRVEEVKKNPATARDTAALSQHVTSYLAILVKKYFDLQLLKMAASFVKAAYYHRGIHPLQISLKTLLVLTCTLRALT